MSFRPLKHSHRIFARFFVFLFVFMWHCPGNRFSTAIWVWSNCFILYIEFAGKMLIETRFYKQLTNIVGKSLVNVVEIFFGSQMLLLSSILTVLYLANDCTTIHIISETYFNCSLTSYLFLSFIMYSIFHSCERWFNLKHPNHAKND